MTEERDPIPDGQDVPPSYTAPTDPEMDTGPMETAPEEADRVEAERIGENIQQTLDRH